MTFHRLGYGTSGLGLVAGNGCGKVFHDTGITAAVAAAVGADVDDPISKGIRMT